jgi:hypothetical protein
MEQMVDRIHRAARTSDYKELHRIVHMLITIGACDPQRAQEILGEAVSCD